MTKPTAPSKLAFTYGALSFSAEGEADWCEKQLNAFLSATAPDASPAMAPDDLLSMALSEDPPVSRPSPRSQRPAADGPSDFSLTLTNYLKARAASNRRFHRADAGGGRVSVTE